MDFYCDFGQEREINRGELLLCKKIREKSNCKNLGKFGQIWVKNGLKNGC